MTYTRDILLTGCAPVIWGSSYIVSTAFLPDWHPVTVSLWRALPAGVLLLLFARKLPPMEWVGRIFVLGALNFSLFWLALFVAAYRLPGGVAATLGAVQPLIVLGLSAMVLKTHITRANLVGAGLGICGVALLVLGPEAKLDAVGALAALCGAVSMGCGVVLTKRWSPPATPLISTAWQLTAGGLLLLPAAAFFDVRPPDLSVAALLAVGWLSVVGAAVTYVVWFRGIARLGPSGVTLLGFLSPLTAALLGWFFADEHLSTLQLCGATMVLFSIWHGRQRPNAVNSQPSPLQRKEAK